MLRDKFGVVSSSSPFIVVPASTASLPILYSILPPPQLGQVASVSPCQGGQGDFLLYSGTVPTPAQYPKEWICNEDF